ncbi:MAG: hypothetical protein EP318_05170 [Rhodobacteraceae bacterium]|nr:MAG: hypothetical protein EP318_05170 [Paracoccaceae bacterium]
MKIAGDPSTFVLAASTFLAATFVAVQAFYARTSYVEGEATRFLERKLDICFENFDTAARIDGALRHTVPGMASEAEWPPKVRVKSPEVLARIKRDIVPLLDGLEAGLTKAQVLGGLDKYRSYLAQQLRGLSKRLMDMNPATLADDNKENAAVFNKLSEFMGAQYSVFTGCRLVAEGKS